MSITVTSANPWPIKCWTCKAEIGDHMVKADGDVFCSQGCAIAAGCYEPSECTMPNESDG